MGAFGVLINGLGFSDQDELYATGESNFYKIDLTSGNAELIGSNSRFQSSGDLVFDSTQQRFFATSTTDTGIDRLFAVSLTGESTEIGEIGFNQVYGLFFADGILYGHTRDRQQLVIDINTGQGQFIQDLAGVSGEVWGTASLPTAGSVSTPEPFSIMSAAVALGAGVVLKGRRKQ